MRFARSFSHHPDSVTAARRFVADLLSDQEPSVSESVQIMVSELATNCIRHTPNGFELGVELTEDAIRVEVSDRGDGVPSPQDPPPTQPSGRGLRIVAALADDWGVTPVPTGKGKTVWFTRGLTVASKPV